MGGLTKPMKLSADLLTLLARKKPAVPNASNNSGPTSRKTISKTLRTSNSLSPTRRWPRFSVATVSVLLAWPNFFLPICLKSCFPLPDDGLEKWDNFFLKIRTFVIQQQLSRSSNEDTKVPHEN